MDLDTKRKYGIFYTTGNPFKNKAFQEFAKEADIANKTILEPFAGSNHLIDHLKGMGLCNKYKSYDIKPTAPDVEARDSLIAFPEGFEVCITNPPWLAKNRARRLGIADIQNKDITDMYQICMSKCLVNCGYIAILVPESFIRWNIEIPRLRDFVSLSGQMFRDTNHPVGLALISPYGGKHSFVWRDDRKIGELHALRSHLPKKQNNIKIKFNSPDGNVGLIGVDNTKKRSIRFCDPSEIDKYQITDSNRVITKIKFDGTPKIDEWNKWLNDFRHKTDDVFLTAFKGKMKNGSYRRRLDYALARNIMNQ